MVAAASTAHAAAALPAKPQPLAVLGIDEVRRAGGARASRGAHRRCGRRLAPCLDDYCD